MPFAVDGDRNGPVRIEVRPSAVLDLSWLLYLIEWGRSDSVPGLRDDAPALAAELAACLGDGMCCLTDLSILAERIGTLLTDDIAPFLAGLERAAQLDGAGVELRSEAPEDRQATLDRLELLRREPAAARRYARLLSRIWELVQPQWESDGHDAVRRALADLSDRQRRATALTDLVPNHHIVNRSAYQQLIAERRRIVVSPMYFTSQGGSLVDMTTFVHIGVPAQPESDPEALRRKESELIADRLKILSDPTRVALLRELKSAPASVMDLARRFGLAQPTVSNHIRLLRDARLLQSRKDGPRIVYTVDGQWLERILDDTRHLLLEH